MAKTLGAAPVIASVLSATFIVTSLAACLLYARFRGAEAEATRLQAQNNAIQAKINNYVLATGNGDIVCDGGFNISPDRMRVAPLSPTEKEALLSHMKHGWCKANLPANNGQQ